MFTLSQGQFTINLPEGFGVPIMSDEKFSLATQVLNHNIKDADLDVRHRVLIDFIRDKNLKGPLVPVFPANGFVMALVDGETGVYNVDDPTETQKEATCLPGLHANSAFKSSLYTDKVGQKFTGHWVVKPGKEQRHTRVTDWLNIPYDTTLHYVALHVHPFAETMELKDLTTGKTIFKSKMNGPKKGVGIESIKHFTSKEGVPMYKDHEYEMVSTYNNTSGIDQDAMASMFLYLADKEFQKPGERPEKQQVLSGQTEQKADLPPQYNFKKVTLPVRLSDEKAVLHTVAGDIVFAFYPDVAPDHGEQVKKLIALGAYDTTHFFRVEPGFIIQVSTLYDRKGTVLTAEQIAAIQPLKAEFSDLKHVRGMLSMARLTDDPDSGDTSFYIMLDSAPHLDQKYTIFGEVVSGFDVIDRIVGMPQSKPFTPDERVEIKSAEITFSNNFALGPVNPSMSMK
jgi:cyclophilin family peptidyl-prolyl cis-trans isomerase